MTALPSSPAAPTDTTVYVSDILPHDSPGKDTLFNNWGFDSSSERCSWDAFFQDGVGPGDLSLMVQVSIGTSTAMGEIHLFQDPRSALNQARAFTQFVHNETVLLLTHMIDGDLFRVVCRCNKDITPLIWIAVQTLRHRTKLVTTGSSNTTAQATVAGDQPPPDSGDIMDGTPV